MPSSRNPLSEGNVITHRTNYGECYGCTSNRFTALRCLATMQSMVSKQLTNTVIGRLVKMEPLRLSKHTVTELERFLRK